MGSVTRRRLLGAFAALAVSSCAPAIADRAPSAAVRPDSPLAANPALGVWPEFVTRAPLAVRQAYEYAAGKQRSLQYIPCYCGCGALGHDDNLSCYVTRFATDGWVVLDAHGGACGVCVGITHDVIAMERQGVALAEIRRAIDVKWASAGPSTPTRKP